MLVFSLIVSISGPRHLSWAALTPACRLFQMKDCVAKELQQQSEETELLHVELHMLETERAHLSLVEEKLVDILQLLQQLRDLVSGNSCVSKTAAH